MGVVRRAAVPKQVQDEDADGTWHPASSRVTHDVARKAASGLPRTRGTILRNLRTRRTLHGSPNPADARPGGRRYLTEAGLRTARRLPAGVRRDLPALLRLASSSANASTTASASFWMSGSASRTAMQVTCSLSM